MADRQPFRRGPSLKERRAHLARSLFRALNRRLESGRPFSWSSAGEHALGVIFRDAERRPETEREALIKVVRALAETMPPPTEPGVLEAFCEAAAAAALTHERLDRHPGARLSGDDPAPRRPRDMASAALYAEYAKARSDEDLLQRAVTRALRERRRQRRGRRPIGLNDDDPVRDLLDLPRRGPASVPAGDVRAPLVQRFGSLLKAAAPFSEALVRPALGEELWARCRPVGFADARRTRILVEVPSSPLAHELQMERHELLRRLRTVPGLEEVKDLRFQVKERTFVDILGRR